MLPVAVVIFFVIFGFYLAGGIYTSYFIPRQIKIIKDLVKSGHTGQAKKLISKSLAKNPKNPELKWYKAKCEIAQNQLIMAIVSLNDIIKVDVFTDEVTSNLVHQKLASLYQKTGRSKEAITEYFVLLENEPDNYEANYKIGEFYFNTKKYNEAIKYLKGAAASKKNDINAYLLLAEIYLKKNDFETGQNFVSKALNIDSGHPRAVYLMGRVSMKNNNFEQAIDYFDTLTMSHNEYEHIAGVLCGINYRNLRRYAEAIEYLEKHLNHIAEDSDLLHQGAKTLLGLYEKMRLFKQLKVFLESYETKTSDIDFIRQKKELYQYVFSFPKVSSFMSSSEADILVKFKELIEHNNYIVDKTGRLKEEDLAETMFIKALKYGKGIQKTVSVFFINLSPEIIGLDSVKHYAEVMKKESATSGFVLTPFSFTKSAEDYVSTIALTLFNGEKLNKIISGMHLF